LEWKVSQFQISLVPAKIKTTSVLLEFGFGKAVARIGKKLRLKVGFCGWNNIGRPNVMRKKQNLKNNGTWLERASSAVTKAAGSSMAFILAAAFILVWLITGPLFNYSDTWQLVINTATTIITFLMVFLIQRSQNKESIALHLKLNELVAAHEQASNRLVNVEDLTEDELKVLQKFYTNLSQLSKKDQSMQQSHSIEESEEIHKQKLKATDK
jgi:low affinity Fe/Cu permease